MTAHPSPRRVLGIDPGTRLLGWGVIEPRGRGYEVLGHGVLRADPREDLPTRLGVLAGGLRKVVEAHQPTEAAIEETFHGRSARAALSLGEGRGAAIVVVAEAGLPVTGYANNVVKRAVTGAGRAGKERVQAMVMRLLGLVEATGDAGRLRRPGAGPLPPAAGRAHAAEPTGGPGRGERGDLPPDRGRPEGRAARARRRPTAAGPLRRPAGATGLRGIAKGLPGSPGRRIVGAAGSDARAPPETRTCFPAGHQVTRSHGGCPPSPRSPPTSRSPRTSSSPKPWWCSAPAPRWRWRTTAARTCSRWPRRTGARRGSRRGSSTPAPGSCPPGSSASSPPRC